MLLTKVLFAACLVQGFLAAARAATISNGSYSDAGAYLSCASNHMVSSNFENEAVLEQASLPSAALGTLEIRIGGLSAYPKPGTVNDLGAVTVSSDSISLGWTVPAGDDYLGSGGISKYLVRYSTIAPILNDGDFLSANQYFQGWTPLEVNQSETRIVEGFTPATTYYFIVRAVNKHRVMSELSNVGYAFALVPLPPMNLCISADESSVTLSWINPPGYAGRIRYNDMANPAYPYEIMGYRVYTATSPLSSSWTYAAETSSDTLNWSGVLTGQEYFYYVAAYNKAGISGPSCIRGSAQNRLYFVSPDKKDLLTVAESAAGKFVGQESSHEDYYTVEISSHPEDLKGRILRSVEFAAYKGGLTKEEGFKMDDFARVELKYSKSGGDFSSSSAPDYKQIGIYYYNGSKWINLYGGADEENQVLSVETKRLGRFQVRKVERLGSFAADASGLMNRMITPNGDGKNDKMVFIFDNPRDSAVKGKIFDLKGALVGDMRQSEVANSLEWDAKSGGRTVPGGVYVYQLESEGEIFNGTVVVVK